MFFQVRACITLKQKILFGHPKCLKVFELKYFFTNSISGTGSGGSRFSKEGVKQIVKEIIEKEKGQLSDNKIVEILANRGIKIARRTVAKYRKELGIMSSFDRK